MILCEKCADFGELCGWDFGGFWAILVKKIVFWVSNKIVQRAIFE
jgi:hypothetical protein